MAQIFANISPKNKVKLLYTLEAHTLLYKKNITILSALKNDNVIVIIESGNVQIIRTDAKGDITIIEDLKENDILGTSFSSLANSEYDVITKEDSKLIIIDYLRIINEENTTPYYHQFVKNLLEIITEKISEKNKRIEILTKKTIRDKILEYFEVQANKVMAKVIYLPISYKDFANYLAVDRSAMMRELKNLENDKIIKRDNRKITLLYR